MVSPAQAIAPLVFKDAGYDAGDFAYIGQVAKVPNLLLVHPSLPVTTVRELIALAKTKPGALSYASSGGGASPELAMELLKQQAKIDIMQVTYKGSGSAIIDQVAGRIELAFTPSVGIVGFVTSGKLRPIAVSTLDRFPIFPKLPTLDESGLKGFEGSSWQGVVAPAGLATALTGRLNHEIVTFMRSPAMQEKLIGMGGVVVATSAEEFDAFFKSEGKKWATVATKAGLFTN
jgi:tripartite-type tricarboxylate transporter receptor subunit TctC